MMDGKTNLDSFMSKESNIYKMVRTKVFIGNLSFKVREAELAQQFEAVAKVVSVNIITRGPRSLGYGFVELESEEDAKKAVEAMNKKEIDGRPINVDLAKVRAEGEAAPGTEGASPNAAGRRPRQPRAPRANNASGANATGNAPATGSPAAEGSAAAGNRPPRRPRQPRAPKAEGEASPAATNADGTAAARPPRRPRQPRAPKAEGEAASPSQPKEPRAPRQPRQPRPPTDTSNRVQSETSLFVANLPFALTNESFGKLLTDSGLKYKTAHVVTKRNQKSKGFGFVEFDGQEDQKKALDALTGKKIEDRELVPKIALVDPKKPADAVPAGSPATAPASAEAKTN